MGNTNATQMPRSPRELQSRHLPGRPLQSAIKAHLWHDQLCNIILYHHGEIRENDAPSSEKARRLVKVRNTAVAALDLLNTYTRTYLDSQEKAMETLNGLLSVEKTDIAYTVGENTYHVNIWNGVASAEIKYKRMTKIQFSNSTLPPVDPVHLGSCQ